MRFIASTHELQNGERSTQGKERGGGAGHKDVDDQPRGLQCRREWRDIHIKVDGHHTQGEEHKPSDVSTEIAHVFPEQGPQEHRDNQQCGGEPKLEHVGPGNSVAGNASPDRGEQVENPAQDQQGEANSLEGTPRGGSCGGFSFSPATARHNSDRLRCRATGQIPGEGQESQRVNGHG